jgi:hypothetical protein
MIGIWFIPFRSFVTIIAVTPYREAFVYPLTRLYSKITGRQDENKEQIEEITKK